ncbi:MAG: lysophospholipid acyltransferase family protein [Candidatus Kerfeldbacteria bacterium]
MTAYPIARRSFFPFVSIFAKAIEGVENIPDSRPVIVASNHLGLLDPLFIGAVYVRRTKRKLRYLVDTSNKFWYFLGFFLQYWTNTIPVNQRKPGNVVETAVVALKRGDSIGVFPEGRASPGTALLPGHTGAIRMSLLSGAPILPVGIENTNVRLMTIIGRRFAHRQEGITIRFGEPYTPKGDANDHTIVRSLTDDLMHRIAALSGKPYVT